jgi:hypothetical protein
MHKEKTIPRGFNTRPIALDYRIIRQARYSMQRIKMYRDRGSPCLIPLDGEKFSRHSPFTKMEREEDEMQDIISSIQEEGKLKNWRVWRIKDHSRGSYAFLRSIFKAMVLTLLR